MDLLIRPMRCDDTDGIIDFFRRSVLVDATIGEITGEAWGRFVELDVNQHGTGFLVAQVGAQIIGLATSSLRRRDPVDVRHFRIIIEPAFRREGIARTLLTGLTRFDDGAADLDFQTLCPREWRAGQAFLVRFGFSVIEREVLMHCVEMGNEERDRQLTITRAEAPSAFAAEVAEIHNHAYAYDVSFVPFDMEGMARLLSDGCRLWLAWRGSKIIGFSCCAVEGDGAWMESIAIEPKFQSMGFGTQL